MSVWCDFERSKINKSITEVPGGLSLFEDHWGAARIDGLSGFRSTYKQYVIFSHQGIVGNQDQEQ